MKIKQIISIGLLIGFAIGAHAEAKPATIELWNKQCKKCHGETGAADTNLGKKLEILDYTKAGNLAEFTDEDLFAATKDGVADTKMKGYGDKLSDEEINDLVAYIRSFAK